MRGVLWLPGGSLRAQQVEDVMQGQDVTGVQTGRVIYFSLGLLLLFFFAIFS